MLAAVKQNGWASDFASYELRSDREIVLTAVKQNGLALKSSDELRSDREFMLAAVKENNLTLKFASIELLSDREFMLAAEKEVVWAAKYASPKLRSDREFMLAAAKQNFRALEYSSNELRSDREFMLAAVKQNVSSLEYASDELKADLIAMRVTDASRRRTSATENVNADVSMAVQRVGDVWQVRSNGNWSELPQGLCGLLSTSYSRNPRAVVQVKDLFGQPGTFLFNLINMRVIDVSRNNATLAQRPSAAESADVSLSQLIDNFIPDFSTLTAQGAVTETITAADVVATFDPVKGKGIAVPQVFVDYINDIRALPPDTPIFEKVSVARPPNISREDLTDSYSDRLYLYVWNRVMDTAEPTAGVPGVQLRNVTFVNNPTQLRRFTATVGELDVSHPPQVGVPPPSDFGSCHAG